MKEANFSWSAPIALADIPDAGQRFDLAANEDTRAQLAKLAGLRTLPRLEATFDVARHGARGLRITGRVAATVGQACVVTLEPIDNEVEEDVNLVFAPPRERPADADGDDAATESLDLDAPEPLIGDIIDLGAIATEFLLLGIDPYPRKPGTKFEPPPLDDAGAHPFAALAVLKKGQGVKND